MLRGSVVLLLVLSACDLLDKPAAAPTPAPESAPPPATRGPNDGGTEAAAPLPPTRGLVQPQPGDVQL